jgi:hypothetical protein
MEGVHTMANDPLSNLTSVNSKLDDTVKKVTTLESSLKRISGIAGNVFRSVSNVITASVGFGNSMSLGTNNAAFGGTPDAGGNVMPWAYSKTGAAKIAGVQLGLGIAGAGYAALPSLNDVMPRAMGFYQATTRMPGVNSAQLTAMAMTSMRGGITGVQDQVAAVNMLTQGFNITGKQNLMQSLGEVAGAAKAYGMSNPAAAQAIGGMHTGAMSGNLYQFGISTLDVKTGRVRTMSEIAQQVYSRVMGNRKLTDAQLEFSLREGTLNKTLNDLGFDQGQQQILRPMLSKIAKGQSGELLNETGANNPYVNTVYKQAESQAKLTDTATPAMIDGFEKATSTIVAFNAALERLTPNFMFAAKGFTQGLSGSNVGAAGSAMFGGVGAALGTLATAAGVRALLGRGGAAAAAGAAGAVGGGAASVAGKVGLTGLGRAVPVLGGAIGGATGQGFLSTIALGAVGGGIAGSFAGGVGAVPGALLGGGLSALGWLGTKAFKSMFATSANAAEPTTGYSQQPTMGLPANADQNLLSTLQAAGFSGQSLATAYGIAKAESGGRATAFNPNGMDESYGIFQINMENNDPRNPDMGTKRNAAYLKKYGNIGYKGPQSLFDPNINAKIAYDMSKGGTNFKPWTTYTSGKYMNALDGSGSTGDTNNNVNINLTISKATDTEAIAFAKKVKEILLKDKSLNAMGTK